MNTRTKELIQEARKLSPEERIELVEDLLDSLEPRDVTVDQLWTKEARDRLDAYRSGKIETLTLDEVLSSLAKP